ncbi:hypothetical protein L484_002902 [Morus notabilis]|uniref:Uncharacterized protein n=1 Tax=Morus notabilis TaxID=981085 RepID=W9QBK5_9ROSA|nr:hypothetical protein L484_002902 [Morus notabilis]
MAKSYVFASGYRHIIPESRLRCLDIYKHSVCRSGTILLISHYFSFAKHTSQQSAAAPITQCRGAHPRPALFYGPESTASQRPVPSMAAPPNSNPTL